MSAPEHDLAEALRHPGCPVCRVVRAEERRYWFFFLHEGYQEPEAQAAVRAAVGYCHRHLAQLARGRELLALAALARASVIGALERLDGGRLARTGSACSACAAAAGAEASAVERLASGLAAGRLRDGYASSDGLCFDHLGPVLDAGGPRWLADDARARLERHVHDLGRLVASFDHRAEPPTQELAAAWRRAFAALRGDPGRIAAGAGRRRGLRRPRA